MERIKLQWIESLVEQLNEATSNPVTSYTKVGDKFNANIGNYHLYEAYGAVGLHQMVNEGGGITEIFCLGSKRETYEKIKAYLRGITLTK